MKTNIVVEGEEIFHRETDNGVTLDQTRILAKNIERMCVFKAYQDVCYSFQKKIGRSGEALFAVFDEALQKAYQIPLESIVSLKIERYLKKIAHLCAIDIKSFVLPTLAQAVVKKDFEKCIQLASGYGVYQSTVFLPLLDELKECIRIDDPRVYNQEVNKFLCYIHSIMKLAEKDPRSFRLRYVNRKILHCIRHVCSLSLYKRLKEDEDNLCISFIHSLAISSLAEPNLLTAFEPLALHFCSLIESSLHNEKRYQNTFSDFVKHARKVAEQHGVHTSDRTFKYLLRHGKYLLGALLSMKVGSVFSPIKKYDPRGYLENNAGAFFEEKFVLSGTTLCTARTVYTPSPTVGNHVSEEAKAVLQGLENTYLSGNLSEQYCAWVYVNLQNIAGASEGPRSFEIMQLAWQYPFSFFGCSLSQDNRLQKAGITTKNEYDIVRVIKDENNLPLNEDYAQELLHALLDDNNFHFPFQELKTQFGYFFSVKDKNELEELKIIFHRIIRTAFHIASTKQKPGGEQALSNSEWNWYQKAAFRELVLLGIITYFQGASIKKIVSFENASHIKVLFTQACKENIDRGGKTNAELYWAKALQGINPMKWSFASLQARALLGRARVIHPHRALAMFALTFVCSQSDVHNYLVDILQDEHIKLQSIVPMYKE